MATAAGLSESSIELMSRIAASSIRIPRQPDVDHKREIELGLLRFRPHENDDLRKVVNPDPSLAGGPHSR